MVVNGQFRLGWDVVLGKYVLAIDHVAVGLALQIDSAQKVLAINEVLYALERSDQLVLLQFKQATQTQLPIFNFWNINI